MSGVSTPTMAAAVSNAGALGSIAIGASNVDAASAMVAATLMLGASAGQPGAAFIACPESLADDDFRAALHSEACRHTVMTRAISGRPARCLANRFTALGATIPVDRIPNYPIVYDAGKALNAAAKAAGKPGFGAHWAGQGAPLARCQPGQQGWWPNSPASWLWPERRGGLRQAYGATTPPLAQECFVAAATWATLRPNNDSNEASQSA